MPHEDDLEQPFARPQDDPRRVAAMEAAIAERRRQDPPVNCWVFAPLWLDLFVDGSHRAHVDKRDALISILDEQGRATHTFGYLSSESAYEAVESHLGIARIEEVRDESDEGWGDINPVRRQDEERDAGDFRSRYHSDEEIMHYLWAAARSHLGSPDDLEGAQKQFHQRILESIVALVEAKYDKALSLARLAADAIPEAGRSGFSWLGAFGNCGRAVMALERFVEIQNKPGRGISPKTAKPGRTGPRAG